MMNLPVIYFVRYKPIFDHADCGNHAAWTL